MSRECSQECEYNCMECDIPGFDPEYCEDCSSDKDIVYEFAVNHRNGCWECDNCRQPV